MLTTYPKEPRHSVEFGESALRIGLPRGKKPEGRALKGCPTITTNRTRKVVGQIWCARSSAPGKGGHDTVKRGPLFASLALFLLCGVDGADATTSATVGAGIAYTADGCTASSGDDDIRQLSVSWTGKALRATVSFYPSSSGGYTTDYGVSLKLVYRTAAGSWAQMAIKTLEPAEFTVDSVNTWGPIASIPSPAAAGYYVRAMLVDRSSYSDTITGTCAVGDSGTSSGTGRHHDNAGVYIDAGTSTTATATTTTMTSTTTTNYIDVTCEIGQFVEGDEDDADYKECKPCPKNTFMDESKASTQICLDQTKCEAGEKIDADSKVKARECTACADGYYNRGGGMSKKSHRGTMCTAQATCPPGEQHQDTSASEWTSTKLKCFGCPGGKFNPGNNEAEVSTGNCMPFKQAPCVTSSGEYELRAPSKISDRVCGSTGPCDTDTEYEANPDRGPFEERECSTLTTCAPGYKVKVQSTKTTDRTCVLCDANTYQDAVGHVETECKEHVACNKGQYAVKTDAEIANEPVVAARECTKCPSGTYQRKSGFETACTNQKGCGPGQRTTADSFTKANKCTSCRVSADECPTTQYPEASACVSTYQPGSKYRSPQCLPNLVTSCGINEYMLNRQSLIAPQSCMPCVQKGDGTGGVGEGGYMDLDSHSFSECIAFSTHTSSATSTATTTPTTTGTTTPFSTATTTPTTTVTTGANFNLVIFSVKNGNANDGFLFDTLLAGRERTGSFEQAVKAAYPGVLRIDHLAPGMDNAWLTPRICKEGRENCFKCGPISIVSPLTGNACMRCKDSTYLHQGECVSNCPAKFNGEGQGLFDRRCIEETGNKAPKARSGIVATLVFEDAAVMEQFESDTAGCLGSMCIEFEETTLCPRTRDMAACAEAAASASSIGMIAGGAGGFLVLLIMVILIARSGGSKGDDEGYGGYEGASYEGAGAGQVVAFENPMYANGEGGDDDDSGEEGEGMYDEPESFGGPQADAEEGGGLYDEPEMIADGDDDNGDAGYLDVAGDDEEPAASSEEEEEEEAGEDDEEDDE